MNTQNVPQKHQQEQRPQHGAGDLQLRPRAARRPRSESKTPRGLPEMQIVRDLAAVYLTEQRRHWPDLLKRGLLADPADSVEVTGMAEVFCHRHTTGQLPDLDRALLKHVPQFAACYSRYSCDNSSPTSVTDQIVNELRKARTENRFIPWCYCFADYAISGLDRDRTDYVNAKAVLADPQRRVDTLYIDDFTRASRDELEWWRLAAHVRRHGKRLIGASDGFDLTNSAGDLQVTMFGLLSKLFIKGQREKVGRGMRGAVQRGTSTGKPALGDTLTPAADAHGAPVIGTDGTPTMKLVIDPSSRTYVEMAFSLYGVEKGWSYGRIAKHFNSLKVDGSDGWTGASIRQLLARPLYIGVRIFNKVRYERDPETNKLLTIRNPRRDWVIKRMPELRFISNELWKQVRRRAAREQQRNPNTGRRLSRNERCASTVFSGTLVCGSCGHEITLGRSGKYKVFACRHGTHGTHGCTLNSYKSVKILEECLLGYIRHRLLSEPNLHALVQMANEAVERELTRPPEDLIPLEVEQTKLEKRKARLAKLLTGDEEEEDLLAGLKEELKSVQKRLNEAGQRLRAAQDKRRALPTKLEPADVLAHVAALNETLAADVPAAAEAIRALTGQIRVTQRKAPGRRGAVWVVRLRPNVAELLDVPRDSPAAGVSADEVEIVIEPLPKAVRIAPQVRALMSQNARVSVGAIAQQLKIPWLLARASVQYVTTGKLPNWSSSNRRSSARSRTAA